MIPDYSKPSLISISTEEGSISFTAPSNGYIIGSGFGDGQAKNFLYLHCGDVSIRQQGNSNENIGSIFPVKKGDVVGINFCFSQKNNGIYFVPTVWLNSKAQIDTSEIHYRDPEYEALGGLDACVKDAVTKNRFPKEGTFFKNFIAESRYLAVGYRYINGTYGLIVLYRYGMKLDIRYSIERGILSKIS